MHALESAECPEATLGVGQTVRGRDHGELEVTRLAPADALVPLLREEQERHGCPGGQFGDLVKNTVPPGARSSPPGFASAAHL